MSHQTRGLYLRKGRAKEEALDGVILGTKEMSQWLRALAMQV